MGAFEIVTQYGRMLENLDAWLQKGAAYAQEKGFNAEVFVNARLAPDQYALVQQIQSACDAAKYAAAYLSNQKAPSHPDTETTLADLRARLATCIAYLKGFKAGDFTGAEERRVAPPWMGGKSVRGETYIHRLSVPNFYFHVTTAYAILRHNGIPLGKQDFIGVTSWEDFGE
jgi:uncharacterized protein